ncbi:PREDICTED: receptor expression-enhancing protein 4-like [Diuraphis noxia]|uniref:receptor expression-enhancing protein 4-like n=1 Tax=Diuraphis noxia TaxID=143948 RepID=UPI00076387FD|nr:PREDICTED: receptor expression-enhancing protein 4-like [Diuraphis noxia]
MLPDFLCRPLIMLFGILYPGYMSYKVLKTKRSTNYGIWLMYWITFSMFTSVETITDIFIGPWLPFYNELKLLFLYMTYPTSDSSLTYVYKNIISPFIKRHEKDIDAQISNFKKGGLQTLMIAGKKCTNILLKLAIKAFHLYGIQAVQLQNISMNIDTTLIENSEPDGYINWEEVINDSEDDTSFKMTSSSESLTSLVREEPPEYSFSDMYGNASTNGNGITYDPPSSNTRRRKKAP